MKLERRELWKHFDFCEFRANSPSSEQLLPSAAPKLTPCSRPVQRFVRHTPLQSRGAGGRRGERRGLNFGRRRLIRLITCMAA